MEEYKFIYSTYLSYLNTITDIEKKKEFIKKEKLISKIKFGVFNGNRMNLTLAFEGALFVGSILAVLSKIVDEYLSMVIKSTYKNIYNRDSDIVAWSIIIVLIMVVMIIRVKKDKVEDKFDSICIECLTEIEELIR